LDIGTWLGVIAVVAVWLLLRPGERARSNNSRRPASKAQARWSDRRDESRSDTNPALPSGARDTPQRRPERPKVDFTYVSRKPLHPIEQELYWKLRLAIPSYSVLPQVALSQIVEPIPNVYEAWNPIAQKVVDFLVLRRDFTPLCVIELDGRHHQEQKQKDKDARRDAALQMAGIPVIRWTPRDVPSGEDIARMIKQLDRRDATTPPS